MFSRFVFFFLSQSFHLGTQKNQLEKQRLESRLLFILGKKTRSFDFDFFFSRNRLLTQRFAVLRSRNQSSQTRRKPTTAASLEPWTGPGPGPGPGSAGSLSCCFQFVLKKDQARSSVGFLLVPAGRLPVAGDWGKRLPAGVCFLVACSLQGAETDLDDDYNLLSKALLHIFFIFSE